MVRIAIAIQIVVDASSGLDRGRLGSSVRAGVGSGRFGFPPLDSGVHRLARASPPGDDPPMDNDILIAGSMALGSVLWLVAIIVVIARATRETPAPRAKPEAHEPTPALRPAPGW
jgi:hypothetical protein